VQEFFEVVLPSRFKPEKAKDVEVTVQINLLGSNSSDWVITIRGQKLEAVRGITGEAELSFKMLETVFLELVNGKISIENVFFSGKVNFKGDITVALKLKNVGFL
jgi:predicted lipid carrier protein YhbT